MAGGADGDPLYVTGPIAENVAAIEVELIEGRVLDAPVYEAPASFDTDVDFYFLFALARLDHGSSSAQL